MLFTLCRVLFITCVHVLAKGICSLKRNKEKHIETYKTQLSYFRDMSLVKMFLLKQNSCCGCQPVSKVQLFLYDNKTGFFGHFFTDFFPIVYVIVVVFIKR